MTRKTPLWRLLAVAGAASLVLAACGGDDDDTEAEPTGGATDGEGAPAFEGTLNLGTLLPQTGSLAFLGPPEFAGVDLAVQEINEAGGVGGNDVTVSHTDSGDTTTDIASQSVERLLSEEVAAIIGAASSAVSFTVLDQIVQNETIMFSPANTSPDFTTYDDDGLYFRTAPSDVLQGRVMGDLVLNDGYLDVGIMALQDPYGEGLAENTRMSIEGGGGTIVEEIIYDPAAASYTAEVTQMAAANPEAIVLIGFDETSTILPELETQGIGPQDVPLYFVDGNLSNYGDEFPEGFLEGNKGTLPGAETSEEFQQRLLEINPDLNDFSYAPESFDATVLIALAAIQAGSVESRDIADNLIAVSRDGTKCTTFAECVELLGAGEDIDYDGASGPVTFSDAGDPSEATIGIYQYQADNTYTNVDYQFGSLEED
ncbi:MAG TPA: ABC transporter substrate-binding protein [Jiangellaceae bacterium]|nr:ABC transporter substrate-binding protein [Jiangellaceae bacterium]